MKIEHIDVWELGNYPELVEAFSIDLESDTDVGEQLTDLYYDCDHVKTHGEPGRGDHCFVDYKGEDTRYIIHLSDADDSEAVDLINWWLDGAEGDLVGSDEGQIDNNWNAWDTVKTGVAYRGGSGYCYALYAKELV